MAYDKADNRNRFAVWPNDKKRPDKQDADLTGTINVNGVEYYINAWDNRKKTSFKAGTSPVLSGTIRPKLPAAESREAGGQRVGATDARSAARSAVGLDPATGGDFDDSIPF